MPHASDTIRRYFQRTPAPVRIGVYAAGHHIYWPQFAGLRERLLEHHAAFVSQLCETGAEVIDGGMSDSPVRAREVGDQLRTADIDLLIVNVVTYSVSATTLPVVQRTNCPVVLAGLQPDAAMDYPNATTFMQLFNDNTTSLPEISCALHRAGRAPADVIFGKLHDDDRAWRRLGEWVRIGRCLHILRRTTLGAMGHAYEGMLDMNSDPTLFDGRFGMHVSHLELDDLRERVEATREAEIGDRVDLVHQLFDFPAPGSDPIAGPVDPDELRWAARVSLGLERLIGDFGLDGLAYYYRGLNGNANERLGSSLIVGSSLLTGLGVPIAGELDIANCVAMLIMDRLGAGGSFAELHPADFREDFVLVGHDGPHHMAIAEGKPVLRGLSVLHGKSGRGPSVEFSIRNGPITILGLTPTANGTFKFVLAEGESLPGLTPATGNTNTRGRFHPDVRTFIERWALAGPTHHFALGVGHEASVLAKLAHVLGFECVNVTNLSEDRVLR